MSRPLCFYIICIQTIQWCRNNSGCGGGAHGPPPTPHFSEHSCFLVFLYGFRHYCNSVLPWILRWLSDIVSSIMFQQWRDSWLVTIQQWYRETNKMGGGHCSIDSHVCMHMCLYLCVSLNSALHYISITQLHSKTCVFRVATHICPPFKSGWPPPAPPPPVPTSLLLCSPAREPQ